MILVDTSVWVDHLRAGDAALSELLNGAVVLTHPMVIGELAMGALRHRKVVLHALQNLPHTAVANDPEVLAFIDHEGLHGRGIGYIDAHLLAAVRLTPDTSLWTRDKKLLAVANALSLSTAPRR